MAFEVEEDYTVLDLLHEMQMTQRAFFNTIRFFDGRERTRTINLFLQNVAGEIGLAREHMRREQTVARMVVNLPLNMDLSGNFFDAVPVAPTEEQIVRGVESNVSPAEPTTCPICQENVTTATRIRACGHCFHDVCIRQWFSMNPRCPMCRHDIREPPNTFDRLLRALNEHPSNNEGRRVHPHEES